MTVGRSLEVDGVAKPVPFWFTGKGFLFFWLMALVSLLAFVGTPSVTRTQEARVLETARAILENPRSADTWLLPKLNGLDRLRKPPLPYWLTAVAFTVGGINEGAGRTPTALCFWLTIGLTYLISFRLLGSRVAWLSAAALATSYLPYRHARLAETDAPAALFVTAAVWALLRASDDPRRRWHYLAATFIGLAFNAKGLPGFFPLGVLLGYAWSCRRWDIPARFISSGAVVLMLALGGSWYVYAASMRGPAQLLQELQEVGTGQDHDKPAYIYIPYLLQATAPWCGMVFIGTLGAARRWKTDPVLRLPLIWATLVLLALLLTPNKQPHYLLPAMPPMMMLAGWAIDVALGGSTTTLRSSDAFAKWTLIATLSVIALAGLVAIPIAERLLKGSISFEGSLIGSIVGLLSFGVIVAWQKRGKVLAVLASVSAMLVALPLFTGYWYPSVSGEDTRLSSEMIRAAAPNGPYLFYGSNISLPVIFYLREPIPIATSPDQLSSMIRRGAGKSSLSQPTLIVYREDGEDLQLASPAVAGYVLQQRLSARVGRHLLEVYNVSGLREAGK